MNVLIIEDEKLLQLELIKLLENYKDFEVVKCIQTVSEGVSWLKEHGDKLDLIFMDIELSDGISFEIFDSVEVKTPIIFLTAYSEYAIRAFKVNSIDYLLKPISSEELEKAIEKFSASEKKKEIDTAIFQDIFAKHSPQKTQRLLIQTGDNYSYITVDEIAYFVAEDKYTTIVSFDGKRSLLDKSLNQLETILPPEKFYRPTRNVIVNIEAIVKASKYFNSRLKLSLKPQHDFEIIISRAKVKSFLDWMGISD
ncbi:LytR/AlgR family response regulator transcription factor [Sediminitomix flava]|uniref:LytTR family two component transcriptional regulator n=1 Tax=Sediminitomix flava TaxID=379075 RepID=A0A316A3B0_SEDFL|nr:LytTR family DNA-binding domain-containing protein [Sediminitomix flava]PWJ44207.1 LytTR family two component transcriptional regulator [Sediminitomix flava]